METVTSADGTKIAYEKTGEGPPLILTAGALTDRAAQRPLAEAIGNRCTVFNFDRRGRGDSENQGPVVPEREIEDIAALIEVAGGSASLYGHSSGAALAFRAGAALDVENLILHEPPFSPDDQPEDWPDSPAYARQLTALLADGKDEEAVVLFMSGVGMPDEMLEGMKQDPYWPTYVAMGPSLAWDSAAMGDAEGGRIPHELVPKLTMPTVLLEGSKTFPFMIEVGTALARELPDGHLEMLEGQDHEADPAVTAGAIERFLNG